MLLMVPGCRRSSAEKRDAIPHDIGTSCSRLLIFAEMKQAAAQPFNVDSKICVNVSVTSICISAGG
jgi:hypothetical protein